VDSLWADLLDSSGLIFDTCGQPLFTLAWTGVRLYFMTSFHTYIARSEVGVRLPLFTLVLTGVRQYSFAVGASELECSLAVMSASQMRVENQASWS
jgi:hypothetical protein